MQHISNGAHFNRAGLFATVAHLVVTRFSVVAVVVVVSVRVIYIN